MEFFSSKIFIEAKHCPATSDVRSLISRPLPACQSETIFRLFDDTYISEAPKCSYCYSCLKQHSNSGCERCDTFLTRFLPQISNAKVQKSVASLLNEALEELFDALGLKTLLLENEVEISSSSFIRDFIKMVDEVHSEKDIVDIWHVDQALANTLFTVFEEVLFGVPEIIYDHTFEYNDNSEEDETSEIDSDE